MEAKPVPHRRAEPRATQPRSARDVIAGSVFLAIAAVFGWEATSYEMGQLIRMGPGFIPLLLAVLLAVLAITIIVARPDSDEASDERPIPWRGIILISFALIVFGTYGRSLGLVPAVLFVTFVTALASKRNSILSAAAISAVLTILCFVIFKVGLEITMPTFGPALQIF